MLTFIACPRGQDVHGDGSFGAPRGNRTHRGVDFAAYPGSVLLSPVEGVVTKLGYPYSGNYILRYVEVTSQNDMRHRFFYVDPQVTLGSEITEGTPLGVVQELPYRGITQHVHYEIKLRSGSYIDPADYHNR